MNCLSCYKKHLAMAYVHCNLYLKNKNDYNKIRAVGQILNAYQHGRRITERTFDESYEIYDEITNDYNITKELTNKIYMAYINC